MKNRAGIFITGTDTGVGKTLICGAIARALFRKSIDCGIMKPIESGCRRGNRALLPSDGQYLQKAAKVQDPLDLITPCRFQAPLSPYAAMLQGENDSLSWPKMEKAYKQLRRRHAALLLEGAGGLMVPVTADKDMSDVIRFFKLPVLLVARSGLGTLNHSLLSLAYGRARGLSFLGIVLNQSGTKRDPSEVRNADILQERSSLPVMTFPPIKAGKDEEAIISESADRMAAHPIMDVVLRAIAQTNAG